MSYATLTDLQERYQSDVAISMAADADLQNALTDATETADSYLAGRYTLPLAVVPGVLVRVVCDIAQYQVVGADAALMTEERRKRYEDAIKWLREVSTGVINITALVTAPVDADADGNPDPQPEAEITSNERLFTRTNLAGVL